MRLILWGNYTAYDTNARLDGDSGRGGNEVEGSYD